MKNSLRRWLTAISFACATVAPGILHAQTKLSMSDTNAKLSLASEAVQADYYLTPPEPVADRATLRMADVQTAGFGMNDYSSGGAGCSTCWSSTGCDLDSCESICCVPSTWFSADYMLWWTKGNTLPALVTTSPAGTAQPAAGVLGLPTTTTLFGNGEIDDDTRNGMRFTIGHWADPEGTIGLQASYFVVFDDDNTGDYFNRTTAAIGGGTGAPILARPFFNVGVAPAREDSQLVSFTGPPNGSIVDGSILINSSSELQSGSLLLRRYFRSGSRGRIDLIGGYRYFRLRDSLLIQQNSVSTQAGIPVPVGTPFNYQDVFKADNEFHGGDMGIVAQFWEGNVTLELLAKVALGNLHRSAVIAGNNSIGAVGSAGGVLALPTNIGTRTANDFAALPELGVTVKYEPTDFLSFNVGYSVLGLNDVTRTGEMIDRVVNSTQLNGQPLVGAPRPMFLFGETDFWAHGFNFGVTLSR